MEFNRKMKIASVLLLSIFIASCASAFSSGVKEKNKDTTGKYDGLWTVEVQKAAGVQYVGKWHMTCGDMRQTFKTNVNNGIMNLGTDSNKTTAFVSKDGDFKLVLPLSGDAQASMGSGTAMANGDRKLILSGTLSPDGKNSKGYITYGIAEVGYGGCTAKTKYTLN